MAIHKLSPRKIETASPGKHEDGGGLRLVVSSAGAMSLAVNAPGHLKKFKTTRLMSAKEFLEAQKKAHGASYKAPTKA